MAEQIYLVINGGAYTWDKHRGFNYQHDVDGNLYGYVPSTDPTRPAVKKGVIAFADVTNDLLADALYGGNGSGSANVVSYRNEKAALSTFQLPPGIATPFTFSRPTDIVESTLIPHDAGVPYAVTWVTRPSFSSFSATVYNGLVDPFTKQADPMLTSGLSVADSATGPKLIGYGRMTDIGTMGVLSYERTGGIGAVDESTIYLNGMSLIGPLLPGTKVVGVGNFVDDMGMGRRDEILFKQGGSGELVIWDPKKGAQGFTTLFTPSPGWSVVATGDLSGDGVDDILLNVHNEPGQSVVSPQGSTAFFDFVKGQWTWVGTLDAAAIRGIAPLLPDPASGMAEVGLAGLAPPDGGW
ncbi:MAG TPA: hypothetical protein VED40_10890 [Azospirillaceae bacterium]|nr:hypothetical protein [Azospirillaceae bacterium]